MSHTVSQSGRTYSGWINAHPAIAKQLPIGETFRRRDLDPELEEHFAQMIDDGLLEKSMIRGITSRALSGGVFLRGLILSFESFGRPTRGGCRAATTAFGILETVLTMSARSARVGSRGRTSRGDVHRASFSTSICTIEHCFVSWFGVETGSVTGKFILPEYIL